MTEQKNCANCDNGIARTFRNKWGKKWFGIWCYLLGKRKRESDTCNEWDEATEEEIDYDLEIEEQYRKKEAEDADRM